MVRDRHRTCWLPALALSIWSTGAWAQVRAGSEFQVNTYTPNRQWRPSVARDADGDFVVVWESTLQDGEGYAIVAQRFSSAGATVGAEFRVNTRTADIQAHPSVAAASDGDFVVAWQSRNQDGSGLGIFAQRFSSAGSPLASEFQVNSYTVLAQIEPFAAATPDGELIIVWQSSQDGSGYGVFGRRYSSIGDPVASEFQINVYTTIDQNHPSAAMDTDGDFVVAWEDAGQDGSAGGVFARRYSSEGTALGGELQINSYTGGTQEWPAIAMDPTGSFVIAWGSGNQDGSAFGVFAQRFSSAGGPLGAEFQVNTYTLAAQRYPSVAVDADGDFLVAWVSNGQDGNSYGVFARRFASDGGALTSEFQVSTFTIGYQRRPAVSARPAGDFVVAWSSSQDSSAEGVFAQRFVLAATLDVDSNGSITALSDGLLIMRRMFGLTGTALISNAVSTGCSRCDAATITPYLVGLGSTLDVDGNGSLGALSDGLLTLRWMFGLTGSAITNAAVGAGCTRCDAAAIVPYLEGLAD